MVFLRLSPLFLWNIIRRLFLQIFYPECYKAMCFTAALFASLIAANWRWLDGLVSCEQSAYEIRPERYESAALTQGLRTKP